MTVAESASQSWSDEAFAEVGGGIELCYQTLGETSDPPVLLIIGLGAQMLAWPDGLCELLRAHGLFVIRFDNRDCGRSTWLDSAGTPSLRAAYARELDDPPYLLSEMAADAAGLLDALAIDAAHLVGSSLGGFVAQVLAIEHPERVLSLASLMSSTGSGRVGQPSEAALEVLMTRPPEDLDAYVDNLVAARRVIGSPGFELDEPWLRAIATRYHQRGVNPPGTQRQLVASICSGDRTAALAQIDCPTVVVHGTDDALIDASGGRATAEAIPGAELVLIEGMGHDYPAGAWQEIVAAVVANIGRGRR